MDSLVRGRIWPNGSFVLWKHRIGYGYDPEAAVPIGLSKVANSHRVAKEAPDRVQRGLKGITRYGQNMVTNAAYLLQQVHGAKRLSFLTCTLPGSPQDTLAAAEGWADIIRVFYQSLKRELLRHGLSPCVVGVSEIQPKRFLRTGGMPLHLHAVFQGAPKDYHWCISPQRLTEMWKSAVSTKVPSLAENSFSAAVNVQMVRDNAAGYLGKYMSKGEAQISHLLETAPELASFLPSTWYNLSKEARELVFLNMSEGESVGLLLEQATMTTEDRDRNFKYAKRVELRDSEGNGVATFWIGEIHTHMKRVFGLPQTGAEVVLVE